MKVTTLPTGTGTPAPRRTRPKATASGGGVSRPRCSARRRGGRGRRARLAHPFLVLPVLEDGAEGDADRGLVEVAAAEGGERRAQSIVSATPGGL